MRSSTALAGVLFRESHHLLSPCTFLTFLSTSRWVVASEVPPNHLRPATLSITVAVNWLFSFTISKITPIMLNNITYGTFLLFGFCCLIMALWAYICLPETSAYALEDIKYLFEKDVILRSIQDAPGGKIFLRGKRAPPVEELKRQHEAAEGLGAERTAETGGRRSSDTSSSKEAPV